MTRIVLTIVVPLLLPSVGYLLWVAATTRAWPAGGPAALPWQWLIGSGLGLTILTLVIVTVHYGKAPDGTYIPPRVVGGTVVPGHVVPDPKP